MEIKTLEACCGSAEDAETQNSDRLRRCHGVYLLREAQRDGLLQSYVFENFKLIYLLSHGGMSHSH